MNIVIDRTVLKRGSFMRQVWVSAIIMGLKAKFKIHSCLQVNVINYSSFLVRQRPLGSSPSWAQFQNVGTVQLLLNVLL
jgi:hypothetical protein